MLPLKDITYDYGDADGASPATDETPEPADQDWRELPGETVLHPNTVPRWITLVGFDGILLDAPANWDDRTEPPPPVVTYGDRTFVQWNVAETIYHEVRSRKLYVARRSVFDALCKVHVAAGLTEADAERARELADMTHVVVSCDLTDELSNEIGEVRHIL